MRTQIRRDLSPIQCAIALSMLLHAAILAVSRTAPSLTTDPNTPIDLRLWIEAPGEQNIEHDEIAAVRPSAVPADVVSRTALPMAAEEAQPTAQPTSASASTAEGAEPLPSPPEESSQVLAAVGGDPDQDEVLPIPDIATAFPTPLPAKEMAMLSERVNDWSQAFSDLEKSKSPKTWRSKGQRYTAHIERQATTNNMDLEHVSVVITTDRNGQKLETRMQMKRLAFSNFTKLVDQWDTGVQLHDDDIHGRIHINSEFLVGWDRKAAPNFDGKVTTASAGYIITNETYRRGRKDIFPGGLETGAQYIVLPRHVLPLDAFASVKGIHRQFFANDTAIIFYPDGSYGWQPTATGAREKRELIGPQPLYLLASPTVRLQVHGTVAGTVLVYSPETITVTGNLTYANNVRHATDADDYLGLVSGKDIVIAGVDVVPPGNLIIEAAIYAGRRFVVEDLHAGRPATLVIFGSLSAGSVAASEPRYATKLEFDPRFERLRPPGFPVTNRYELDQWDRRWTPVAN
jgi:hypothetical protein